MDHGAGSYRRYLAGDEAAFDQLITEYFDGLLYFVNQYTQDLSAAEDIAIDVFSDLIVHKHRYNFSVSMKTYLYMLGKSRALNYLRRQQRQKTVPMEQADSVADLHTPETVAFSNERKKALYQAMSRLPQDQKTVVYLTYFEELSCDETAKVMGKNRKQVYNLLYRAKTALRTIFAEEGVVLYENL